jgi:trigger factor
VTLTIHAEEDDKRQLKLKVEVSEERIQKAMRVKARELAREIHFRGFRKGKVPYNVVLLRVGRETVRAEAVDDIIQEIFSEVLDEVDVDPYAQPLLDDMQLEPLVMEFTVPLTPIVKLGDYRQLRKEIEPVVVSEEALEEALEQAQIEHQTLEPVDRPVQAGDMVTLGGKGELAPVKDSSSEIKAEGDEVKEETAEPESEFLFDEDHLDLVMDDKKLFPGTPFVENLIGLSAGDETAFGFTFPVDYEQEDLAGREATFDLTIIDVNKRDLPPLDDELAKLSGDYETLDEMREALRKQLQTQAENLAKEELVEGAIDDMLEDAEVQYPPAALENELDDMLENFKNQVTRANWEFDDYLKIQGSTEESLREDFREAAQTRLKRQLILRQFMLDEKLQVNIDDLSALVDERVERYENEDLRKQMREFYLQGVGFDMISSEVLSDKVHERLIAIYSGEAPDLEDLAAEAQVETGSEEE